MATLAPLSTAPFEHPALDYAALRAEGIQILEQLAGRVWTDFNVHDPGVTLLEQLCYALTDLGYRASYAMPDLLASSGAAASAGLFSAREVLTSEPVTLADLRRLVLDVVGVENAWVSRVETPKLALYYHPTRRDLGFRAAPPYTAAVVLQGYSGVAIEASDLVGRGAAAVQQAVSRRLHASRPLCTDFESIAVLEPQNIQVQAELEIAPVEDPESVLVAVYQALAKVIAPRVPFAELRDLSARLRSDQIFEGPALERGFLELDALEQLSRRDALATSDLIHAILDVQVGSRGAASGATSAGSGTGPAPGSAGAVRAVRRISVSTDPSRPEPWRLELDPARAPRLDLEGSVITLTQGALQARLDRTRILRRVTEALASVPLRLAAERDYPVPAGRDRKIAGYTSIQHQLPAIYGVGEAGLSAAATVQRRAQALQLKAYLLFFDQLLANENAQLAAAGALLSFQSGARTHAARAVDDPQLGLEQVRQDQGHQQRLEAMVEAAAPQTPLPRRIQLLNHLLARFGERFSEYSLVQPATAAVQGPGADAFARAQQQFLADYPRISGARGSGADLLELGSSSAVPGGAEERIRRKLGLDAAAGEALILVEHLLLAPVSQDNLPPGAREYEPVPLLSAVESADPYSLQLSCLLPGESGRSAGEAGSAFRRLVEQTIREEVPAHLVVYVSWLSAAEWTEFRADWAGWQSAQAAYRQALLGALQMSEAIHLRARDARDRIIDALGLGETYPLRDLPVRDERLTVPFNQAARIPLDFSQVGVRYELRSSRDGSPITRPVGANAVPVAVDGTGGTVFLDTPPMQDDTVYSILARKLRSGREAYLRHEPTVRVGLDVTLRARILDAEPLVPGTDAPRDSDARIVAYGAAVRVQIDHAQDGVDYQLVTISGSGEQVVSASSRGNLTNIVLSLAAAAAEDVDLRIRATKVFDPAENRPTQSDLLAIVLPLRVRARLDLPVALEPGGIVAFQGSGTLRIDQSQPSASYAVYARALLDSDFAFSLNGVAPPAQPGEAPVVSLDVPGAPTVFVRRPASGPVWVDLAGFQLVAPPTPGTGKTLRLPLGTFARDSVLLVRAQKQHQAPAASAADGAASRVLSSSVQLARASVLLVQPDPAPRLQLIARVAGTRTTGTLELRGGQPGVYYSRVVSAAGAAPALPGYFHKLDDQDATLNKGLGQLRVEVDLALSRGSASAAVGFDRAKTPPLPPLIDTGPIDLGTQLQFRAVKAQTSVGVALALTASLATVPEIGAAAGTVAPGTVPPGGVARIVIRASVVGERYQLALGEALVGKAMDGNGKDLTLQSDPLTADAVFEVRITRPNEAGIAVERRVLVAVRVGTPG